MMYGTHKKGKGFGFGKRKKGAGLGLTKPRGRVAPRYGGKVPKAKKASKTPWDCYVR
jgi:hypothetical protein